MHTDFHKQLETQNNSTEKHEKFQDTEQKLFNIKQHKNGQLVEFAWKLCKSCQKLASQN